MDAQTISSLLTLIDIHPILVDIGASGDTPTIWEALKPHSIYVGFDPDLRAIQELSNSGFYKAWIVNKAITALAEQNSLTFNLTRSPYCSSTLQPDKTVLSHYLFADLFTVQSTQSVSATTLDISLEELELNTIQWLKLDTQGTDLRIFTSISAKLKSHLLAVDLEPGIIPFYQDEDIFEKLHKELIQQGFWLSQSRVLGSVRVSQSTVIKYPQLKEGFKHLKTSPGWVEARYLRTLESLQEQHVPKTDYVLLWLFAMLDKQYGYALDVVEGYRQGFGEDALFQKMHHEVIIAIKVYLPNPTLQALKSIFPRSFKRGLKNSLKQWLAKFQS